MDYNPVFSELEKKMYYSGSIMDVLCKLVSGVQHIDSTIL